MTTKRKYHIKNWQLWTLVLVFVAVGGGLLLTSHAATPTVASEVESGAITSPAVTVADTAASGSSAVRFSAAPAPAVGGFTVSGNLIKDATGAAVTVRGVDRPSLEWSCSGKNATNNGNGIAASDFATMRTKWNANTVRLPLDQDFWLSSSSHYCSNYAATVAAAVKAARANHLIVILDLHWSDKGDLSTAPAQQCMADKNSVTFWQQVAAEYKADPSVWFELYNEPHPSSWSIWQNGGSVCGFTAVGMQALYNAVRSTGATNIVIAGGDRFASHLDGAPMLAGTNIAYAIHPYAADSSGGNANTWSNADWDTRFGNMAAKAPVIATEFGDHSCGSTYDQGILNYFRAHKVGYTAWAWYSISCGWPSLISDAAGDCEAPMGCTIQKDMLTYPSTLY